MNRLLRLNSVWLIAIVALGLMPGLSAYSAFELVQEEDLDSVRKLRNERKFDLAEKMISRLQGELGPRDHSKRVLLQIELLKSKTARAFEEKTELRMESYQSIIDSIERFERQYQSNPNLILVLVQKAMTGLKFGELIRKEIEAGQLDSGKVGQQKLDEAFKLLRLADRQFGALDEKLALMIPGSARKAVNGELNQRQLISLQNQIRYQRIKTKLNRGMLYGSRDPDNKVAVIMSARNDLTKVIPLIEKVDPSWWHSRLDLLRCLREVGEFETADKILKSYPVDEASADLQLAFRAEEIRTALALKNGKKAESIIAKGRLIDGVASPDFDYAILEYFIFLSEQSKVPNRAETQKTIGRIVRAIEEQHGAYWGRRANLALVASARSTGASGSSTLILLAQDLYRKKKYDEAISQFEKAADAARKELNRKLELELRFQAIVIHRNLNQHDLVVNKSREVAKQFGDTNRGASVHMIGILAAAEMVRLGKMKVEDYIKMIDFHLQNWQHHATVGHVAMYRGDYDLAKKDFVSAAIQFRNSVRSIVMVKGAIDLDGFEKSMLKLSTALKEWRQTDPGPREVKSFQNKFEGKPFFEMVLEKTSDLEASINGWATFALEVDPSQLNHVFDKLKTESKPQAELLANLIRVAIRSRNFEQVKKHLGNLTLLKKEELNSLLQGFDKDWHELDLTQRKAIADCILRIDLDDSFENRYWQLLSQSLIASGNHGKAFELLERMKKEQPASLNRHLALARGYCSSSESQHIERGLLEWRKILSQSRERTDSWYEAKYEIARCHLKLGNANEARSILDVMHSIPPGWSKSKLKSNFDALYRKVSEKN